MSGKEEPEELCLITVAEIKLKLCITGHWDFFPQVLDANTLLMSESPTPVPKERKQQGFGGYFQDSARTAEPSLGCAAVSDSEQLCTDPGGGTCARGAAHQSHSHTSLQKYQLPLHSLTEEAFGNAGRRKRGKSIFLQNNPSRSFLSPSGKNWFCVTLKDWGTTQCSRQRQQATPSIT